jgi:beta-barrel assembly-enhancing protease
MTTIHVTQGVQALSSYADFLDGDAPIVHRAAISVDDSGSTAWLIIAPPDQPVVRWPIADLRKIPDQASRDMIVLARKGDPVARLMVSDPEAVRILAARAPNLKRGPEVPGKGRLLGWAVGAVASVALIVLVLVPLMADQLAELLPPAGERALGDTTFEQVRVMLSQNTSLPVEICEQPAGLAALHKMTDRLTPGAELPNELTVRVLDHDLINAFALPGGQIILFRGLIDAAETPEEVAAVLAHEIGHVVARDPARIALRTAGSVGVLGLLFGDFAGGAAVLFMTERLIQASYSRDAENNADVFALDLLQQAGLPPAALATMFERFRAIGGDATGMVAHFSSHPALGDRIARAAELTAAAGPPVLDRAEWRALQSICGGVPTSQTERLRSLNNK